MGINTHLYYSDTPYADTNDVAARLEQLGIVHIRDGLAPGRPDEIAALNVLAGDGIKSDLLLGQPGTDPTSLLDVVNDQLSDSVEAIEGPNEYDRTGDGWQANLLPFQSTLYQDVHSTLPWTTVVAASVGGVSLAGSADVGNIHPYPGGNEPEDNVASQVVSGQQVSGTGAVWATETGYHDAVNMASGTGEQPATPDAAQAIYLPRLFADYFAQGIQRTYIYELLDEFSDPTRSNPEADFGLLNNDLTPKPQFYALANLTAAVRDTPNPDPLPLSYTMSDSGTSLDQLLLSRADGSWQVLLWRAEPVNAAGVGAPSADVTVDLPFCADLSSQTPSDSADVDPLGTGTQFTVSVGAALQILSVQRANSCATSTGSTGADTTAAVPVSGSAPSNAPAPGSTPAAPVSGSTPAAPVSGSTSKPTKTHGFSSRSSLVRISKARVAGLSSGRVTIAFHVDQGFSVTPEIQRLSFMLPAGLVFTRLHPAGVVSARGATLITRGARMTIVLRNAVRSFEVSLGVGTIKESESLRASARRRQVASLTIRDRGPRTASGPTRLRLKRRGRTDRVSARGD
jgi:hypothetical protein